MRRPSRRWRKSCSSPATWAGVIEVYERRIGAESIANQPREQAAIHCRIGQVHHERLSEPELAIACYREALQIDSHYRPALTRLRKLHASQGQWVVAVQIGEVEVGATDATRRTGGSVGRDGCDLAGATRAIAIRQSRCSIAHSTKTPRRSTPSRERLGLTQRPARSPGQWIAWDQGHRVASRTRPRHRAGCPRAPSRKTRCETSLSPPTSTGER